MTAKRVNVSGQEYLVIDIADFHQHIIPLDAIASWSELLGLETVEEVIAAMDYVRVNGEPEPDWETGRNCWSDAYEAMGEELNAEDSAVQPETYRHGPFISAEEDTVLRSAGVRRGDGGRDKIHPRDRIRMAREKREEARARTREVLLGHDLDVPAGARAAGGAKIRPKPDRQKFVSEAAQAMKDFDLADAKRRFRNTQRELPR
jgi:hypothetical protein